MANKSVTSKEVNSLYTKLYYLVSDNPGASNAKTIYIKEADFVFEELFGYKGEKLVSRLAYNEGGASEIIQILNHSIGFYSMQMLLEDGLYWNVLRELISMKARSNSLKATYTKLVKKSKKANKKYEEAVMMTEDPDMPQREKTLYKKDLYKSRMSLEKYNKQGKKIIKEKDKIRKEFKKAIKRLRKITGIEKVSRAKSTTEQGGVSFAACKELGSRFTKYNGREYLRRDLGYGSDYDDPMTVADYLDEDGFDYNGYMNRRESVQNVAVQLEDERRRKTRDQASAFARLTGEEVDDDDDYDDDDDSSIDRLAHAVEKQNANMNAILKILLKGGAVSDDSVDTDDDEDDEDEVPVPQPVQPRRKKQQIVNTDIRPMGIDEWMNLYNQAPEYDSTIGAHRRELQEKEDAASEVEASDNKEDHSREEVIPEPPKQKKALKIVPARTEAEEIARYKELNGIVDEPAEAPQSTVVNKAPEQTIEADEAEPEVTEEVVQNKPRFTPVEKPLEEQSYLLEDTSKWPEWLVIQTDAATGMPIKPNQVYDIAPLEITDEVKRLRRLQAAAQRQNLNNPKAFEYQQKVHELNKIEAARENKMLMEAYEYLYAVWEKNNPDLAKEKEENDRRLGLIK